MKNSFQIILTFIFVIYVSSLQLNVFNKRITRASIFFDVLTHSEIERFASFSNLRIKSTIIGPSLKLEAISKDDSVVGYLTAFIRPIPFKLFHLDTIQVKNHRQNLGYKRKSWTMDGPGISFIMGTWALTWAKSQGCQKTELLAVRDTDQMHSILVRLYSSFGFKIKREVDENNTMDRLTWGAVGTLMEMDINEFFNEWTPKTRILLANMENSRSNQ